jgi:hypothetical protein
LANSHLYEIRARGVRWSTPFPDQDSGGDFLDARKVRLSEVLEDVGTKTLKYLYDFGDGWEHTIKIERLIDPEPSTLYPRLIEAKGRCPPEDIGGPWGYAEFLEAIAESRTQRMVRRRLQSPCRRPGLARRRRCCTRPALGRRNLPLSAAAPPNPRSSPNAYDLPARVIYLEDECLGTALRDTAPKTS